MMEDDVTYDFVRELLIEINNIVKPFNQNQEYTWDDFDKEFDIDET